MTACCHTGWHGRWQTVLCTWTRSLQNCTLSALLGLQPVENDIVCLSLTFMRPTQQVKIFRKVSTPFGTLAIYW